MKTDEDVIFNVIDLYGDTNQYKFSMSYETNGFVMSRYGNMWTKEFINKPVLHFKDHGDGVIIDLGNKNKLSLDYSQLQEVYLALEYYYKNNILSDNFDLQKFKGID